MQNNYISAEFIRNVKSRIYIYIYIIPIYINIIQPWTSYLCIHSYGYMVYLLYYATVTNNHLIYVVMKSDK